MLKEIYNRQSIRKYQNVQINEEVIKELLRAAMNAPTARNLQTWRFVVIEKREVLDEIAEFHPHAPMMKTASFAIMVLGDNTLDQRETFLYVNAAAAIENMLIEGVNQGLGSCWCAIGPSETVIQSFKDYFKLADNLVPVGIVAFGVSDEIKEKIDRYDETKIEWIR